MTQVPQDRWRFRRTSSAELLPSSSSYNSKPINVDQLNVSICHHHHHHHHHCRDSELSPPPPVTDDRRHCGRSIVTEKNAIIDDDADDDIDDVDQPRTDSDVNVSFADQKATTVTTYRRLAHRADARLTFRVSFPLSSCEASVLPLDEAVGLIAGLQLQ